jgi:predicted DNA binding protein
MSLIAEWEIGLPILVEAHAAAPDIRLRFEDINVTPGAGLFFSFWASGDDFERFESGLETDPTVDDVTRLTTLGDARLYLIDIADENAESMLYPDYVELGVQILDAVSTVGGVALRVRCPDRETVTRLKAAYGERGVDFELRRIYQETERVSSSYGLTEKQRTALVTAWQAGYYATPRRATLDEIGDSLGITQQSLSQRLRRALDTLVESTLVSPGDDDSFEDS